LRIEKIKPLIWDSDFSESPLLAFTGCSADLTEDYPFAAKEVEADRAGVAAHALESGHLLDR
jgi:hypothetical protein